MTNLFHICLKSWQWLTSLLLSAAETAEDEVQAVVAEDLKDIQEALEEADAHNKSPKSPHKVSLNSYAVFTYMYVMW